jgi:hypothetical protein
MQLGRACNPWQNLLSTTYCLELKGIKRHVVRMQETIEGNATESTINTIGKVGWSCSGLEMGSNWPKPHNNVNNSY